MTYFLHTTVPKHAALGPKPMEVQSASPNASNWLRNGTSKFVQKRLMEKRLQLRYKYHCKHLQKHAHWQIGSGT